MVDTWTTSSGVVSEENKRKSYGERISIEHEGQIGNGEHLLPGILNEITFQQIFPKLEWIQFQSLSAINWGWREALQSHRVYDARVRSQSTETLVALQHRGSEGARDISLYSVRDDSLYRLPRIPGLTKGIPLFCQCVSLDGKLYILGGLEEPHVELASAAVYVLDLTVQTGWKQCASMFIPRQEFGCGVIHGKIYVFGGTFEGEPILESEMFDPQEDVWYPVAPMISLRRNQKVTHVGDELFIHSGMFSDFGNPVPTDTWKEASFAEVYHPLKDEWRLVENFTKTHKDIVLTVGGKVHKMNQHGLHVYNIHKNAWKRVQSFESAYGGFKNELHLGIAVDNVILAVEDSWFRRPRNGWFQVEANSEVEVTTSLIKSKRLVTESNYYEWEGYDWLDWDTSGMKWQKVRCTLDFKEILLPFLCLIQL